MKVNHKQKIINWCVLLITLLRKKFPFTIQLFEFIQNNPLYKGVLILGSGTAVAQLIGIISMPIITRLYTPSDLGILAVYSSILAIVGVGATLRYELAYSLQKDDKDAANLFALCLILLFITSITLLFILCFGKEFLKGLIDIDIIEPYLWFFLVGHFGTGLYTVLNYWAIRQRDYKRITYTKINQGVGGAITTIFLGILSFGPIGLIIGRIIFQIAGIGTLGFAMLKKDKENIKGISLSGLKSVAKEHKSFPLYNFPASIINSTSLQLLPIMLLILYDSKVVGFYSLAYMLMVLPGGVISQSMGQAFLGEASKMVIEKSRELRSFYVKTIKHLSLISVPLIGIPSICAPFLVPIIFGKVWEEAAWYCWPLSLLVIASFVVSPTSLLQIYGCNHWILIFDSFTVFLVICGFYLCNLFNFSAILAITIYALIRFFMYILAIIVNLKAIARLNQSF